MADKLSSDLNPSVSIMIDPVSSSTTVTASTTSTYLNVKPKVNLNKSHIYKLRDELQIYMTEFLGTFLFVLIGDGAIAQAVLNPSSEGSSYLQLSLGYGLGLTLALFINPNGHFNSAVSLASALFRNMSTLKLVGFLICQLLASFCAAALVYFTNFTLLVNNNNITKDLSGIFITNKHPDISNFQAFVVEFICTCILVSVILTVTDSNYKTNKSKIPAWLVPLIIGASLTTLGISLGWSTGFCLNPARDLGPRLLLLTVGYGGNVFGKDQVYFWIPIVAPIIAAIFTTFLYDFCTYREEDAVMMTEEKLNCCLQETV